MRPFKFNLEAVLRWKKGQEEAALKEFGEAMRRKAKAIEELQLARRYLGNLLNSLREERAKGKQSVWNQTMYMQAISRQEGICKHKEEILEKVTIEEGVYREKYLQKKREAEAIEKVKDKRRFLYEKEANIRLEKELEEIVLSKMVRSDYGAT